MSTTHIKRIVITERSVALNDQGKYVFMVSTKTTKNEVKKAIKELYNVDAVAVNTISLPGKPRRYRNTMRLTAPQKKAIVTLKEGQKIDIGR
jgi:large subunit ribosomal protein L23